MKTCIAIPAIAVFLSLSLSASGAGFWGVRQDADGRWWAVAPDGAPAFLRGVDHANWNGHYCEALKTNPYRDENNKRFAGDQAAWQAETLSRLSDWGFNMLGAGCSRELEGRGLAHTTFLAMGTSFCRLGADHELAHFEGIPGTGFPNVFHPDWESFCDERAAKLCAPQKDNPHLFGYFFDNELDWRGRSREEASLYFSTIAAAIRRHDPNHLLLGCRFAGLGAQQVVWEEAGKICDVVTFNNYPWADIDTGEVFTSRTSGVLFADVVAERYAWTKKPLIITEWSFPALDAGLPCSGGAGQRFHTQTERTAATELFARTLLSLPFMIGYDYFMWVDEPALGISFKFPEDSNYGLVNERGEPYRELTAMFTRINGEAETLHSQGPDALRPYRQTGKTGKTVEPPRTAEEAIARLVAAGGPRTESPSFVQAPDGAYALRVPGGLALSGRIGGKYMIDSITLDGTDYGQFTAMLFHGDWQDVERVVSAEWLPEKGVLRVAGELRDGPKAFRVTLDIAPLSSSFVASVVRVDNIGEAPLAGGSVFLRQYAPWATDKLTGGIRSAVNVWKQPDADLWARTSDGVWCGAATTSPLAWVFRYWISLPDKAPHPDAAFAPNGGIAIAPGESYDPRGEMWYVAGYGTGGADGWRRFLDSFAR